MTLDQDSTSYKAYKLICNVMSVDDAFSYHHENNVMLSYITGTALATCLLGQILT